jgi:hypothetical protein
LTVGGRIYFVFYRKFVAEFGETAFHEYYLAHQRLLAVDHLPAISQQYRKDVANAQKEKGRDAKKKEGKKRVKIQNFQGTYDRLLECYTVFLVYSYRNLRETNPASVCPDSATNQSVTPLLSFTTTTIAMICQLAFYPDRRNYTTDSEHDGNPRKWWFLIMNAGLFTKKCVFFFSVSFSHSPHSSGRTPCFKLGSASPQS